MYNARDKRFLGEDIIKGEIQKPMSLVAYSYVLGNLFVYVDFDSKDAIWLTDDRVAAFQGHYSVLIQDENGIWHHFNFGSGEGGGNDWGVITFEELVLPENIIIDEINGTISNSIKPAAMSEYIFRVGSSSYNKIMFNRYTNSQAQENSGIPTGIELYLDDTGDFQYYIKGDFTSSISEAQWYEDTQPPYQLTGLNCAWASLDVL